MSGETVFNVVFQGKLAPGFDRETAMANFARAFKLSPQKAARLFDGQRRVIKKNLSRQKANIFRQQLKQLGVRVALIKVETDSADDQFSLSPPGVVLAPQVYRPPVHIDTSGLAVSDASGPLVKKPSVAPPVFSLEALAVEEQYDALESRPPVSEPQLDLSNLSVDEPGVTIVEARPVPAPEFDVSDWRLDEKGAVIVQPQKPPVPDIPTDHLRLAETPEEQ